MKSCARFGGVARGRVARTVMGTGRNADDAGGTAGRRDGADATGEDAWTRASVDDGACVDGNGIDGRE